MKRNTLSAAMEQALNAWALKHDGDSTTEQIARHAVAHGVTASGLRLALLRANLIQKRVKPNLDPVPAPAAD